MLRITFAKLWYEDESGSCLDTFMFRDEIASVPKYGMTRFIGNVIYIFVTDFSNFNSSYVFLCYTES